MAHLFNNVARERLAAKHVAVRHHAAVYGRLETDLEYMITNRGW
jgi:hypothetical protein